MTVHMQVAQKLATPCPTIALAVVAGNCEQACHGIVNRAADGLSRRELLGDYNKTLSAVNMGQRIG